MNKKLIRKMLTASGGPIHWLRKKLYNNIEPFGYNDIGSRLINGIVFNKNEHSNFKGDYSDPERAPALYLTIDNIWGEYLHIPEKERRYSNGKYKIKNNGNGTFSLPFKSMEDIMLTVNSNNPLLWGLRGKALNSVVGEYDVHRGYDKNGDYLKYIDHWRINPYDVKEDKEYGLDNNSILKEYFKGKDDVSFGLGTPVEIQGKYYLDDIYNVKGKNRGGHYLPEIVVTGKKKQGGKMNTMKLFKKGGQIRKMQTAAGGPLFPWQGLNEEWINEWKFRTTPAAKSRVLQGKGVETDKQYTERRKKETTKRTWKSDAADIAHGIGEGVLALNPYTAIPYFGAKVGQDVLNGNVSWLTALNASVPLFHLSPQAVGLREATNVALEDAANAGSKTARNWRVAREIKDNVKLAKLPYQEYSPIIRTKIGDVEINNPLLYYRLGSKEMGEDFSRTGIVSTDGEGFTNPMFAQGRLWYGIPTNKMLLQGKGILFKTSSGRSFNLTKRNEEAPKTDLLVSNAEMLPANLHSTPLKWVTTINGKTEVQNWGDRRVPATQATKENTVRYIFKPGYGYKKILLEPSTSLAFFERKPARISEAEKFGLNKHDRKALSVNEQLALEDLALYKNSGLYRQVFRVTPDWEDFGWNLDRNNPTFMLLFIADKETMKGPFARVLLLTPTGKGVVAWNPEKNMGGYSSRSFTTPEGMNWAPGEANMMLDGVNGLKVILTAPKTDFFDSMVEESSKHLGENLSSTIDKSIMKDFWINSRKVQRPGSYMSGDNGVAPLGSTLIEAFKKKQLYKTPLLERPINLLFIRRTGLSPDSYSSIIRLGNRDGSLRWGEGFTKWNNSAVENKFINDAFEQLKKGEISPEQYEGIFNKWSLKIGGRPLQWTTIGELKIPVHPHPYIYAKKQGGKMNLIDFLKNGSGIHIKEKNKGKFTSYCGGKVTDECILKGKNSSNPAIRKRATFASNARKWKHLTGGTLVETLGGGNTITAKLKAKSNLTKRKAPDWDNLDRGYRYLTLDMRLPHDLAIAIMGNVVEESQGNYKATLKNGRGRGLIQWDGRPAPEGRYGQWGSIWASVAKKANVYDPDTDTVKNYWAPWNGLKGELVRLKFISSPLKLKARIYAESYLRPGKPRIADRQLSAMQLDSIYNPKIKNIVVQLKVGGKIDFLSLGGIASGIKNIVNNVGNFMKSDTGKSILSAGSSLLGLGKSISNSGKIADAANEAEEAINALESADRLKSFAEKYAAILLEKLSKPDIDVNGSPIHTNGVNVTNEAYNLAVNTFNFDNSKYNQMRLLIKELALQVLNENSSSMIGSVGGLIDSIGGIAGSLLNKKSTTPKSSLIITGSPDSSKQVITTNSGMSGTVDDWRKAILG